MDEKINRKKRIIYIDIETRRGAEEVGGWGNKHLMRMAVGVIYDSLERNYFTFPEEDVEQLIERLMQADLVIGFNLINFDYPVLQPYTNLDLKKIKTFDMLQDIQNRLGFRLSLNHLAKNTLKIEKIADGLQSLQWFKEGKIEKVIEYCIKDVEITRELFRFGVKNNHLLFESKYDGLVKLDVSWDPVALISDLQE